MFSIYLSIFAPESMLNNEAILGLGTKFITYKPPRKSRECDS